MLQKLRASGAVFALMIPVFFAGMHVASSQNTTKLHRYVIQVSRDDTGSMNLALGNAMNAKKLYDSRGEQFQVEIVAYGPGIHDAPGGQITGQRPHRGSEEGNPKSRTQHVWKR